jgi:hypothetical protein
VQAETVQVIHLVSPESPTPRLHATFSSRLSWAQLPFSFSFRARCSALRSVQKGSSGMG